MVAEMSPATVKGHLQVSLAFFLSFPSRDGSTVVFGYVDLSDPRCEAVRWQSLQGIHQILW